MKLSDDYFLRSVFGESILVYTGSDPEKANGLFTLNDTGEFFVAALKETDDIGVISDRMAEEFDIDRQTALKDLNEYIETLRELGVVVDD